MAVSSTSLCRIFPMRIFQTYIQIDSKQKPNYAQKNSPNESHQFPRTRALKPVKYAGNQSVNSRKRKEQMIISVLDGERWTNSDMVFRGGRGECGINRNKGRRGARDSCDRRCGATFVAWAIRVNTWGIYFFGNWIVVYRASGKQPRSETVLMETIF